MEWGVQSKQKNFKSEQTTSELLRLEVLLGCIYSEIFEI